MGCATSKFDDLPTVSLCRQRCYYLDDAIRLRYSLSHHHFSYFLILSSLSHSFPSFFSHPPSSSASPAPLRPSHSGSHIDFDGSDSDSDSDSGHAQVLQHFPGNVQLPPGFGGLLGQGSFFHMNYMRNKASTPSVIFEQRPVSYRTIQFGNASSSSSGMLLPGYPPYPYQSSSSSPYPGKMVMGGGEGALPGDGYDDVTGDYYGESPPGESYGAPAKPPPPPPSPPRVSAWDFLNPFESYEKYYPAYTTSRDSKEMRDEEGIPDLEDDNGVVKEVHGNHKFVDLVKNHIHARKGVVVDEEDDQDGISIGDSKGNDDRPEYEVHIVDKKVVNGEGRSGQGGGGGVDKGSRTVAEALTEIEVQFQRASECGSHVARMLEVGKLPYNRKHRGIIRRMDHLFDIYVCLYLFLR